MGYLKMDAVDVALKLGLEFVYHERGPSDLAWLDEQRDRPSEQSRRNGIGEPIPSEGIVIRPIVELTTSNGQRVIAKHKSAEFRVRNFGSGQLLLEALAIAERSGCVLRLVEVGRLEADVQAWSSRDAYRDRPPPPRRHWLLRWYDLFAWALAPHD